MTEDELEQSIYARTRRFVDSDVLDAVLDMLKNERTAALEQAARRCDALATRALEDMALEKDDRFGVYAKKYQLAALHIRALRGQ